MIRSPSACRADALPNELIPQIALTLPILYTALPQAPYLIESGVVECESMFSRLFEDETECWLRVRGLNSRRSVNSRLPNP